MAPHVNAQKAAGLVPEVFVDLIRKVLPGSVAVALGLLLAFGGDLKTLSALPQFTQGFLFLAFVTGAYIAGFLLDCITGFITDLITRGENRITRSYLRYLWGNYVVPDTPEQGVLRRGLGYGEDQQFQTDWLFRLRDQAIVNNLYARDIIPKTTAEEFFAKNLGCALLVYSLALSRTHSWTPSLLILWTITLLLIWAGFRYRARQTARRILALSMLASSADSGGT